MELMNLSLFVTFLLSVTKAALLLFLGLLIKDFFDSLLPNMLNNYAIDCGGEWASSNLIKWGKWIGIVVIFIGGFYGIQSTLQWLISLQIPNTVREMILNK